MIFSIRSIIAASTAITLGLTQMCAPGQVVTCESRYECDAGKVCDFELHWCVDPRLKGERCNNDGQCITQQCITTAQSNGFKVCD